ncbi:putative rhamnogalacturonase [Colletotrichum fructicola]|uniref:Rhamnogalacturonate lyase n=1 Tax=Colletotrichum fructicola (strain Nara gc5) TaxID=1213859 RepID=A0A7J6ILT1_COLFN|nr:putative rhamnogalacturonase [Colletotrichum fructicola]KAF4477049.1 putative rhamnogalacturonase [Colletotrichum fructicola Nara gc5]KAE9569653.1 putative rhamnogalacturonase [Colletotrichum fructicola]KAF4427016.1 putative rhamnogalacturonase [Colletotrichum fructicola]KAF4900454.1 putative rhamnogalacturonase [Colletotrichum fructicola]KAF4910168.1 putative rhamnogalacturonase [Colletotrichum fructicola]
MASNNILHILFLTVLSFTSTALAAFGVTTSGSNLVVDAGSSNSLVFSVSKSSCDINSIKYRGNELQYGSKGSHISSGLGTATVESTTIKASTGNVIKITCTTSTLTHYLIVKEGEANIYMATYITAEPDIGELRFIARLNKDILPSEYPFGAVSTTAGSSSTVEGSDVFVVSGQTRSKFYSSERFIDDKVRCVYGTSPEEIHVCISVNPSTGFELSSGGPFFRDINTNNAGDSTNLYNYMNSGHVQTEAFRMGLHGPYVMSFSRSGIPKATDFNYDFYADLSLKGYVAASGRGTVTGTASGISSSFQRVVHWYNANAQYWAYASSSGAFTSPAMKPGTYTMVLYQTEFKVATSSVTVTAGKATTANIASGLASHTSLWKIGEYDGQPTGFRNAANQLRMHPSDSRMSSWGPLTYTVGSSALTDFPMAVFTAVNNPVTIKFTLSSAPSGAATLRIATTLSFASGRPVAKVNSWSGATPAAPTKIDSRGVTRGAYRGYGEIYDFTIPAGTLVSGSNTVTITVASGSSGDTYLSPNVIFDCIELFQ